MTSFPVRNQGRKSHISPSLILVLSCSETANTTNLVSTMRHLILLCLWQCTKFTWSFSAPAATVNGSPAVGSGNWQISVSGKSRATAKSHNAQTLDLKVFPRTWVPIGSTRELDPDRPTPIEFLGQKYITYRDNQECWVVLDDACPHRLAPLSEGRIDRDKNVVQCSYHGWEFTSEGKCNRIPQANSDIAEKAMSSTRSSVASYPTFVENQILFVWPWPDDVLMYTNDTWRFPEGIMEGLNPIVSTFTRDLPYGWSHLVENLIDPAHVPFAHHGMQGTRMDAIPINMTFPEEKGEAGFSFEWEDRTMGLMRKGKGGFRAPYSIWYDADFQIDPPRKFELSVLCIPTKPGWSRAIVVTTANVKAEGETTNGKKTLMSRVFKAIPEWMLHIFSNRFLDSDLAFLHYQERELARQGRPGYYMPAPADRCIGALRQWMAEYTGITGEPLPPSMTRSELFDRYAQHSSHCKVCQQGLKTLRKGRLWAYASIVGSILAIQFRVAKVTLLFSLGLLRIFHKLEGQLKVGGFKHYENH